MACRRLTVVAICVELVVCLACSVGDGRGNHATDEALPPAEILEGNFAGAPYVFEIDVEKVKETARFKTDSGDVGYVQYAVAGTVVEVLKASEEHEFRPDEVEYFFTQEYDASEEPSIKEGRRYLVFLKLAEDTGRYWLIGNGAQFESSRQLSEMVRQIAERQ